MIATCFGKNDHILFTGQRQPVRVSWSREENKTSPARRNPIPPPLLSILRRAVNRPKSTLFMLQHEQVKTVEVADNNILKSLGPAGHPSAQVD